MLLFFLSRENPELAKAEVKALVDRVIEEHNTYIIAESEPWRRLQLTRFVCKVLDEKELGRMKLKRFAIRVTRIKGDADKSKIIKKIASKINGKVDLEHPDVIIRVFVDGDREIITEQLYEYTTEEIKCRNVNARPFFVPTSLQPKWARILLNLAGLKEGNSMLDPFCGAGGILLEACTLGIDAMGIELDEKCYEGCKENLWFYHCDDVIVEHNDFLEWKPNRRFDAIVTDLPYGKSTSLFGRDIDELYEKSFKKMRDISDKIVVVGPKDLSKILKRCEWNVENTFRVYVHKSLDRWIHVCGSE
ncbi:MAG: RsmD family RNA methyltransferase [Candidatus Diapherotrites archaeon]|nr:RsmD family RNA methyltransferase [Candidatus Diapherotrites archaeon]